MLTRSLVKKCQIGLKSYAELTVNIKQKLQLLINKLDNIVTVKNALYQTTIFRLLDHRRVFRTQKIVAGINRINDVMKRKTVKVLLSSLTIP